MTPIIKHITVRVGASGHTVAISSDEEVTIAEVWELDEPYRDVVLAVTVRPPDAVETVFVTIPDESPSKVTVAA